MQIQNQSALVTGGAIRIGRAIVETLLLDGMHVFVHYGRSEDEAKSLGDQYGDKVTLIQADLNQPQEATSVIETAIQQSGRVPSVLVNSAAIFEPGGTLETTPDHWDRHFNINLKSAFFLSQSFARMQAADQRGHIVNIVDWRGTRPGQDHVAYTMTKAALIAMTKSLAQDLGPSIQVNGIAPGAILPPPGLSNEYLEQRVDRIPVRRHGNPCDIARTVQFLLASDFISGEIIHVTGGEQL